MALKAVLKTLDDLPEAMRPYYRAGDTDASAGKFILDVESVDGHSLDQIDGLRSAFGVVKEELEKKGRALEAYKGLPAPSTLRDKLRKLESLQTVDPRDETGKIIEARVSAALAEMESKHASEIEAANDEGDRLWGALEAMLTSGAAKAAIAAEGGAAELLMPHIKARTKIDRATLAVTVLREDGTPYYNNQGKPGTIEDLVADFKKSPAFGRAFDATASGSGASGAKTPGAHGVGNANPYSKSTWNLTEQMRLVRDDPGRAAALKAAANTSNRATQGGFNLTAAIQAAKGDPAKLAELKARIGR